MRRCDALNSHRVGSNFSLPFLDTCFELALAKLPATLSNNPWATQEAGSVIWVTAEDREALQRLQYQFSRSWSLNPGPPPKSQSHLSPVGLWDSPEETFPSGTNFMQKILGLLATW